MRREETSRENLRPAPFPTVTADLPAVPLVAPIRRSGPTVAGLEKRSYGVGGVGGEIVRHGVERCERLVDVWASVAERVAETLAVIGGIGALGTWC